jgi:23S rRNA pseudouridine2605 synthase
MKENEPVRRNGGEGGPVRRNSSEGGFVRLNRFLASAGVTSRRKADLLIQEGRVRVNNKVVGEMGVKINPARDKVFVDGKQVNILDEHVYIVFNKPKDCITTTSDERGRVTVMDYVKLKARVFPVGRLDRNTTGVLLLTNDGELANRLMHPSHEVTKAYKVTLDKPFAEQDTERLKKGIRLEDGMTAESEVYILPGGRRKIVGVVIHEGRNREVRRMFEQLGYEVKKLDRVAYGEITVDGLRRGEWRHLAKAELVKLKKAVGLLISLMLANFR